MKKTLTALVVIAISAVSLPANAVLKNSTANTPTLAVIDTALDTSIPSIKAKLIGEVCILDWNSCPNGQAFMEGPGASVLPMNILSNNNFNHGTQMASIAVQNNPNMNILFVRIIGHTADGRRQATRSNLVPRVLEWLNLNKDKYNIQAIAMSQGHHNLVRTGDYCPVNNDLDNALLKLNQSNIPVMFAVGNDRDYSRIDWPACNMSPNVFAIAGAESYNAPATYNNHDPNRTDFFDYGNQQVIRPGNVAAYAAGSSVANVSFAAKWLMIKSSKSIVSISEMQTLIRNTSISIKNSRGVSGLLLDAGKAING